MDLSGTAVEDREEIVEDETVTAAAKPWFCYLLVSKSGQTYIGATVDPDRRLRQHNKELAGGARRTGARAVVGDTWIRLCKVSGFPDKHAALQFEWRWKRLSCKKVYAAMTPVERRVAGLYELIGLDRPTSRAAAYATYEGGGVVVEWET